MHIDTWDVPAPSPRVSSQLVALASCYFFSYRKGGAFYLGAVVGTVGRVVFYGVIVEDAFQNMHLDFSPMQRNAGSKGND